MYFIPRYHRTPLHWNISWIIHWIIRYSQVIASQCMQPRWYILCNNRFILCKLPACYCAYIYIHWPCTNMLLWCLLVWWRWVRMNVSFVSGLVALTLSSLVHISLRNNAVYAHPPALWWTALLVRRETVTYFTFRLLTFRVYHGPPQYKRPHCLGFHISLVK